MKSKRRPIRNPDVILSVVTTALIAFSILIILSGSSHTGMVSDERNETDSALESILSAAVQATEVEYPFAGKINGTGVRLREKPNREKGRIIRELNDAVRVEVLAKEGSWYLVKLRDEQGYIYADYVTRLP